MKTLLLIATVLVSAFSAVAQFELYPAFEPSEKVEHCGFNDVLFVCVSPQYADTVYWDFGDGEKGKGNVILHHYSTYGKFTVKMVVVQGIFRDSITVPDFVYIKPLPNVKFEEYPPAAFQPWHRTYIDRTLHNADSIIQYTWGVNEMKYNAGKIFTVRFPDSGLYRLTLTVKTNIGCTDSLEKVVYINDGFIHPVNLGIAEVTENNPLEIYPNPAKHWLAVKSPVVCDFLMIKDLQGRLLKKYDMYGTNNIEIDVSAYNGGVYVIEVVSKHTILHKRLYVMS